MIEFPLLSLLTFLPLIGAFFIITIRGDSESVAQNAKYTALYTSIFVFVLSLYIMLTFNPDNGGFQFKEKVEWLPSLGISYTMGIDGISLFFVMLSTFLTPICILASWDAVKLRVKEYMIAFLVLETLMIGTFCALDLFLFYVFFEAVLIPMFLIIGIWGGPRKIYASYKFFLYTLLGSVLMLLAMLMLYSQTGISDVETLMQNPVAANLQYVLFLAFFASFAVKMPMWPVHTWLPDAHVEAPTAGSVILAGVLLKMGGYGFLRFSLPMFPEASDYFAPMIMTLSVIAIIYTSLVALVQEDMKKLIAYSSVAHMGFVTLGIFSMTTIGIQGGIFQMISHGLISAALFLCVGVVYDRLHTREMSRYGGIVKNMPKYATVFMIFMLGSAGLPGTSGFIGEFLSLLGTYQVNILMSLLAATGMILGAAYMLLLYRRVVFGPAENRDALAMPDLNSREIGILAPLAVMVILIGVYPAPLTSRIEPSVDRLMAIYQTNIGKTLEPKKATLVDAEPLNDSSEPISLTYKEQAHD